MMFERDLQPQANEYNSSFLRDHIRRSTKGLSELKPDADASVSGLLGQLWEWLLPEPPLIAATIRTALPSHGAVVSLLLRHTVEFMLIFAVGMGVHSYDHVLLLKLTGWCMFNALTFGLFKAVFERDPLAPIGGFKELWCVIGLVTFLPLVNDYSFIEQVVVGVLLTAFVLTAVIPWIVDGPSAISKSASLGTTVLLVFTLVPLGEAARHRPIILPVLLFTANYLLVLPFGRHMQHWFAAHRYATFEDVRCYSRLAERSCQPSALRWRSLCTHGMILVIGVATSGFYFEAIIRFLLRLNSAERQYVPFIFTALSMALMMGTFAFSSNYVAMCKLPRVSGYLGSFYVTWRCIAAWLSGAPGGAGPTTFRFSGLWCSVHARRTLLGAALAIHSALALSIFKEWSAQYLSEAQGAILAHPLRDPTYLCGLLFAVAWSPLALFVAIHASWGPTFETFSRHFEHFDASVAPPIVHGGVRPESRAS